MSDEVPSYPRKDVLLDEASKCAKILFDEANELLESGVLDKARKGARFYDAWEKLQRIVDECKQWGI